MEKPGAKQKRKTLEPRLEDRICQARQEQRGDEAEDESPRRRIKTVANPTEQEEHAGEMLKAEKQPRLCLAEADQLEPPGEDQRHARVARAPKRLG